MKAAVFVLLVCVSSQSVWAQESLESGATRLAQLSLGEAHEYSLQADAGGHVSIAILQDSIDVVLQVYNPRDSLIQEIDFNGVGESEYWTADIHESGRYRLVVSAYDSEDAPKTGGYTVSVVANRNAEEQVIEMEAEEDRRIAAIQWMRENVIPIASVEAETGLEDLNPLRDLVGDARLVALGEATHGAREFFQLKHRMLEFLVKEMGFTVFAIEASMPEVRDINEFVLHGRGDPAKALAGQYFWTWNTEEVLEMILWMRRHNLDPENENKLSFYGFDMQFGVRAFNDYASHLEAHHPAAARALVSDSVLNSFSQSYTAQGFGRLSPELRKDAAAGLEGLLATAGPKPGAGADGRWAHHMGQVLLQVVQAPDRDYTHRDSSMAANLLWIMEERPEAKVVYWAHNGHVNTSPGWMGQTLRDELGSKMVVFGFSFDEGSFQSNRIEVEPYRFAGVVPFHVTSLRDESWDATFGEVGLERFALDLHSLPTEGNVGRWFSQTRQSRWIGSAYWPNPDGAYARLAELYDVMLFVRETTAARPNPGGTRPRIRYHDQATDLGFEEVDHGVAPLGWRSRPFWHLGFGYDVGVDSSLAAEGQKSLRITRGPGKHFGEQHATVGQYVWLREGAELVRVHARMRTELESEKGGAYLWLKTHRSGIGVSGESCHQSMAETPARNDQWLDYTVECPIGPRVQGVSFGGAFEGVGSAWFDAFSVEWVMNATGERD